MNFQENRVFPPPHTPLCGGNPLVERNLQKYVVSVHRVANTLLLFCLSVGLLLPNTLARAHEVTCHGDDCVTDLVIDHHEVTPPTECPCDHDHDPAPGEDVPLDQDGPSPQDQHEKDECPLHGHEHHHHHCACTAVSTWGVMDESNLALHPPFTAHFLTTGEQMFIPDPPVTLLDRPPCC